MLAVLFNGCMVLLRNQNDGAEEGRIAKQPFAAIIHGVFSWFYVIYYAFTH